MMTVGDCKYMSRTTTIKQKSIMYPHRRKRSRINVRANSSPSPKQGSRGIQEHMAIECKRVHLVLNYSYLFRNPMVSTKSRHSVFSILVK